ncbi:15153_t:CDS:2 [Funneliformis mosseae]|uniref:15153_t:CDS:1 n=1 Tax=Funneliformis mosseae TaxID=27381 RepID=A0A9N8VTA2_FUNMO|nr:15153_t:CDS:2 [Funneliformis mosseae]
MVTKVEDFSLSSLHYLDDHEDDKSVDGDFADDDWQWEERLRLINEFGTWTSGNDTLDKFIQQTQLETPDPRFHMQWIPFENFGEVKFVAKGGHSSVFSATWKNKKDQVWDGAKQVFVEKPLVVALKSLKNSQNLGDEFLDEFKRHGSLKLDGCGYIVHCHEEIVDILTSPYAYQRRLLGLDEYSLNTADEIDDVDAFERIFASRISNTLYPVAPDVHPFAFYISRFLFFPNLPIPTNSTYSAEPLQTSYFDANKKSNLDEEITYEECKEQLINKYWCKGCRTKYFLERFSTWTSEDDELNHFIQESQLNAKEVHGYFRWFNYNIFKRIQLIGGNEGISEVYYAMIKYDELAEMSHDEFLVPKYFIAPDSHISEFVVLKRIINSGRMVKEFIHSIKNYHVCLDETIPKCYGITKDPLTQDYMLVLQYANMKSLNDPNTLVKFSSSLSWAKKKEILGELPYTNYAHDSSLAYDICNGKRPKIPLGTPKDLVEILNQCWESDPAKRPSINSIAFTLNWCMISDGESIPFNFKNSYRHHPNAFYSGRTIDFDFHLFDQIKPYL